MIRLILNLFFFISKNHLPIILSKIGLKVTLHLFDDGSDI